MNRFYLILLILTIDASISLDAFALNRDGVFDKELNAINAKDGVPGRRVGGGSR